MRIFKQGSMPLLKALNGKDIKRAEQQERRFIVNRLSFMRGDHGYLTPLTAFPKRRKSVLKINDQALLRIVYHSTFMLYDEKRFVIWFEGKTLIKHNFKHKF